MKKKFLNKSAAIAAAITTVISTSSGANTLENHSLSEFKVRLESTASQSNADVPITPFTLYRPVTVTNNSVHAAHSSHASHGSHASHSSHSSHSSSAY